VISYLPNTQQKQETNIHAYSEIRTRDPSNHAAAELRLRSHGHLLLPRSSIIPVH